MINMIYLCCWFWNEPLLSKTLHDLGLLQALFVLCAVPRPHWCPCDAQLWNTNTFHYKKGYEIAIDLKYKYMYLEDLEKPNTVYFKLFQMFCIFLHTLTGMPQKIIHMIGYIRQIFASHAILFENEKLLLTWPLSLSLNHNPTTNL